MKADKNLFILITGKLLSVKICIMQRLDFPHFLNVQACFIVNLPKELKTSKKDFNFLKNVLIIRLKNQT